VSATTSLKISQVDLGTLGVTETPVVRPGTGSREEGDVERDDEEA
jgi:hypothetical protein